MAFDPDKYLEKKAVEFNPDAYLQGKVPQASLPEPTVGEAALEGAKAGIPFHNQIGGGIQALLQSLGVGQNSEQQQKLKEMEAEGFTGINGESIIPSLSDTYSKGKAENKEQSDAARRAHPLAYLAGNIGSGSAMAGPIMGAGKMAIGAAGKLAPETAGALSMMGGMASQAAPRLANIGQMAGTGAGVGALYGAGEGDAGTGMLAGGLGGAALGTVGAGLGALRDLIKAGASKAAANNATGGIVQQTGRSLEKGLEGEGITSAANKAKITGQVTAQAKKLTDFITKTAKDNWEQKLSAMEKSGQQFDLNKFQDLADESVEWAVKNAGLLPDEAENVRQVVRQMLYKQIPEKTKNAVNSVIKTTKTITPKAPDLEAGVEMPEGAEALLAPRVTTTFKGKGMSPEELTSASEQLPEEGYQSLRSQISDTPKTSVATHTEGVLPEQAVPESLGEVPLSEADTIIRNLQKAGKFDATKSNTQQSVLQNIAGKARGAFSSQAPEEVNTATKTAQTLKELGGQLGQPEELKSIGQTITPKPAINLVKNMLNVSDPEIMQNRQSIMTMLKKVNPDFAAQFEKEATQAALDAEIAGEAGKVGLSKFYQTAKSIPLTAGNIAGQAMKKTTERLSNAAPKLAAEAGVIAPIVAGKKPVSAGVTSLETWPTSKISSLSTALKSSDEPDAKRLGTMLEGVTSGDPHKRSAMLFSISQNKAYRAIIDKTAPSLEEIK